MLFSERMRLVEAWKSCVNYLRKQGTPIADSPENFIAFLDKKGLILDPDVTTVSWTNVETRLPENDGRYLVTIQEGATDKHVTTRYFRKDGYNATYWHRTILNHQWERKTLGVIAWAPLPKGY